MTNRLALLTALAFAFTGCLDFTAAKFQCFDAGWCEGEQQDPPTLISHVPKTAATGVGVNDAIVLNFSQKVVEGSLEVNIAPVEQLSPPQWDEESLTATVFPANALDFTTMYTVQVRGAQAAQGGAVMEPVSFGFTTRGAPDMNAPTLTSTVPANLTMNVNLNTSLILAFSEAMNPETLQVVTNPEFNWGAPSWSASNQTATFNLATALPDAGVVNLSPDTTYAVSIEAEDVSGNALTGPRIVLFTTRSAADTMKPVVLSVSPPSGSTNIDPSVSPAFNFSEPMDVASTITAFSMTPDAGPVTCAFDPTGTLMTCPHPSGLLAFSQGYNLKLDKTKAKDVAGNPLDIDFQSTFTTSNMTDMVKPTIVSFTPDAGINAQPYYPRMSVTFSEPMDKAATQSALSVTAPNGTTGAYSWSADGKTLTFVPAAPSGGYNPATAFSWQVSNTARDLAGNTLMGSTQLYTFTVRHRAVLNVMSGAADGYITQTSQGVRTVSANGGTGYAGDYSTQSRYRSFFYFDLSALPANTLGIETAQMYVYQWWSSPGNPYPSFGKLVGESINYVTPLATSAWSSPAIEGHRTGNVLCLPGDPCPLPTQFTLSTNSTEGWKFGYIDSFLPEVFAARKMMVRVRFDGKDTDLDSVSEYVSLGMSETSTYKPYLRVTYEYP